MTHTILGWELTTERTLETIQALVDRLPQARRYYSDGFETYQDVVYAPGRHTVSVGKRDTYTVEGCNAELRHYIAVLVRKTRCVCRSAESLRASLKLMVHAYNRQQLHRFRYPQYRRPLTDFVSP